METDFSTLRVIQTCGHYLPKTLFCAYFFHKSTLENQYYSLWGRTWSSRQLWDSEALNEISLLCHEYQVAVVVQSLSHVWLCNPLGCSQVPLSSTISQSLLKFMPIESVMPSNRLILCPRLFLLPAFFPRMRVFFNELTLCIRWSKYWSFSFIISPSNVYSGLISFRIGWPPAKIKYLNRIQSFLT